MASLSLFPTTRAYGYTTYAGTDDYSELPHGVGFLPAAFLLELDFYQTNQTGYQAIWTKIKKDSTSGVPAGYQIKITDAKKLFLEWSASGGTSSTLAGSTTIAINTQYRIRLSFDGTTILLQLSTNGGQSWVTEITTTSASLLAEFQRDTGYTVYLARARYNSSFADYFRGRLGIIKLIKGSSDPAASPTHEWRMTNTGSNPVIVDRITAQNGISYGGPTGTLLAANAYSVTGSMVYGPHDLSFCEMYHDSLLSYVVTLPAGTSITINTGVTDDDNPPAAYEEAAIITASGSVALPNFSPDDNLVGKRLWIQVLLATSNTANTPVLSSLSFWVEGPNPKNIIKVTLTTAGRLKYPIGDISLAFTGSLLGSGATPVLAFTAPFTPTGLTPLFNPNDYENACLSQLTITANLMDIIYEYYQAGAENACHANLVVTAALIHVNDLNQ